MIKRIARVTLLGLAILMISAVIAVLIAGPDNPTVWLMPALTHVGMLTLSLLTMLLIRNGDFRRFG